MSFTKLLWLSLALMAMAGCRVQMILDDADAIAARSTVTCNPARIALIGFRSFEPRYHSSSESGNVRTTTYAAHLSSTPVLGYRRLCGTPVRALPVVARNTEYDKATFDRLVEHLSGPLKREAVQLLAEIFTKESADSPIVFEERDVDYYVFGYFHPAFPAATPMLPFMRLMSMFSFGILPVVDQHDVFARAMVFDAKLQYVGMVQARTNYVLVQSAWSGLLPGEEVKNVSYGSEFPGTSTPHRSAVYDPLMAQMRDELGRYLATSPVAEPVAPPAP
jgi:hypothetical protein